MRNLGNSLVGPLEEALVTFVLRRKSLFRFESSRTNSFCRNFENWAERIHGAAGAITLPSASVALSLIMETLSIKDKGKLATSPFCWASVYSAAVRHNMGLEFLQHRNIFEIDTVDLERRLIERNIALIVIPHLLGRGVRNIAEVKKIADVHEVPLVEDFAQSIGAEVGGRCVGSFGRAAYTSFNHHKILSAGDGGLAIFRHRDDFETAWRIHDQGCLRAGNTRKVISEAFIPGTSLRANELTGALLVAQSGRLGLIRAKVEKLHRTMKLYLEKLGIEVMATSPGDIPYVLLFKNRPLSTYPSLLDSGWHLYWNIPFPPEVRDQLDESGCAEFKATLRSYSSLGCGFIDKYMATPLGISLNEQSSEMAERLNEIEKAIL